MSKINRLRAILKRLRSVVVAYSGGLDSSFLLKVALDTLGKDKVLAVTARSETYPYSEYKDAKNTAEKMDAPHMTIHTKELEIKNFKDNPINRCYYCKKELFKKLSALKERYGHEFVVDGTNYDDLKDVRHGRKAAEELGIKSPLLEAKITKDEIMMYSKKLKLPTWSKPSFACLASRIPFNQKIKRKDVERIDRAERYLKDLGFKQVRVRLHNDIARIEVTNKDLGLAVRLKESITKRLKRLGFIYVTLDLAGYRTGSMHEGVVAGSGCSRLPH